MHGCIGLIREKREMKQRAESRRQRQIQHGMGGSDWKPPVYKTPSQPYYLSTPTSVHVIKLLSKH
jgi:hypothetical protein